MRRILITRMSGTGKSSVISALSLQGYKAIDTDWNPDWETPPGPDDPNADGPGWLWREEQIGELLATEDVDVLFVSACVPNQSKLLSASPELTMERLTNRTNNPYGRSAEDMAGVLPLQIHHRTDAAKRRDARDRYGHAAPRRGCENPRDRRQLEASGSWFVTCCCSRRHR
jgi:hypothetical protein